jgi:hypothetical protein
MHLTEKHLLSVRIQSPVNEHTVRGDGVMAWFGRRHSLLRLSRKKHPETNTYTVPNHTSTLDHGRAEHGHLLVEYKAVESGVKAELTRV